ncbi:MAG: hypothetical protein R2761_31190 [Acidimicrobiales bacterium]
MEGYHEFLRQLPTARAERMGQFLHRFPRPWLDRAACEVSEAVATGAGVGCTQAPDLVPAAVASRLRRAFVTSVGGRLISWGAAALVPLEVSVVEGCEPAAAGSLVGPRRGVSLRVAPAWLHEVWGAGAAVVGGSLILALDSTGPNPPTVLSVEWDGPEETGSTTVSARLTVRRVSVVDGRWCLGDALGSGPGGPA